MAYTGPQVCDNGCTEDAGLLCANLSAKIFFRNIDGTIFRQTDSKQITTVVGLPRKTGIPVNYCPNSCNTFVEYFQGQCTAVEYPRQNAPGGDILHLGARERSLILLGSGLLHWAAAWQLSVHEVMENVCKKPVF